MYGCLRGSGGQALCYGCHHNQAFRFIGIYTPTDYRERSGFLQRVDPFPTTSRRVILLGNWDAFLDPDIDGMGTKLGTNNVDA